MYQRDEEPGRSSRALPVYISFKERQTSYSTRTIDLLRTPFSVGTRACLELNAVRTCSVETRRHHRDLSPKCIKADKIRHPITECIDDLPALVESGDVTARPLTWLVSF